MSMPLLSIGLPVWNGQEHLAQAIESLLAQTEPDFELIISDNASTDDTPEICRAYVRRDNRIRYHRFESNQGAAVNHAKVVELANGKYFRWQASDDLVRPDYHRRCLAAHEEAKEPLALVHSRVELIDSAGAVLQSRPVQDEFRTLAPLAVKRVWRCLMKINLGTPMYGVIPRTTLLKTRLIDRFNSSDYVFLLELALLGRILQLEERLFCKRIHPGRSMAAQSNPAKLFAWYGGSGAAPRNQRAIRRRLLMEYLRSVRRLSGSTLEITLCSAAVLWAPFWRKRRNFLGRLRHRVGWPWLLATPDTHQTIHPNR